MPVSGDTSRRWIRTMFDNVEQAAEGAAIAAIIRLPQATTHLRASVVNVVVAAIEGRFRAFDARNGKELWADKLDAPAHSIPSTYMGRDGKQYVVISAGGGGFLQSPTSDTVIAFTLP